jgi:hypothetical protein
LKEEGKQHSKKIPNIFLNSISKFFFCKKTFQEKGCVAKTIFGRLASFNCQKPSSFTICGKQLVEEF